MKDSTKILLKGFGIGLGILAVGAIAYSFYKKSKDSSGGSSNKLRHPNPKKILFIGDSITAIKNYANNTPIRYTYPNQVRDMLESKGYTIDVLAKGGEMTSWMLKNLPQQLAENNYDRIYIQGGGNDGVNLVTYEKFKDNIAKMIELGQNDGADVFVVVGFDQSKTLDPNKVATTRYVPDREEMYKRHQRYFEWQKKVGDEFKDIADGIVPLFDIPKEYVSDGLHPNSKGAKIFADKIIETLN